MNLDSLRLDHPGRRIDYYASIGSTMHAAAGLPKGSVVVAGEQTAGQGRHGHSWHSEPGSGLYCSIVLDVPVAQEVLPTITLALGLATVEAVQSVSGLRSDIRWPNDLMLRGRKVAGILVQMANAVPVAGIGINVNHSEFPEEIAQLATSLRIEAGHDFDREAILAALLPSVDRWSEVLVDEGREAIVRSFSAASSYVSGKRVTVDLPDGKVSGVTAGLDSAGFLRLLRDDGSTTVVLAGGVREG